MSKTKAILVFILISLSTLLFADCKWCGSSSYGGGCPYSPFSKHEHCDGGDGKECVYCGSSSYGSGCSYSPNGKHKHTSNTKKCRYCGSKSRGSGCSYSPYKKHEF